MNNKSNIILVPIDFSKQSLIALRQSFNVARLNKSSITLLYVYEELNPVVRLVSNENYKEIRVNLMERLKNLAKATKKESGLEINCKIVKGKPHKKIVDVAYELGATMIVMGTRGVSALKSNFIGATALRVVKTAPCPVITIKGKKHRKGCKTIIVPLDLTKETSQKVEKAIGLAKYFNSTIRLVSFIGQEENYEIERMKNQLLYAAMKIEDQKIEHEADLVKYLKSDESIAEALADYAQHFKGDLIAIMTQEEESLSKYLLGSSAQEIIRTSEIPVLSIRPDYKK
jgi:nucleotide-binding universal stress UspA family protein